jgi:signal transduction histidine kinase
MAARSVSQPHIRRAGVREQCGITEFDSRQLADVILLPHSGKLDRAGLSPTELTELLLRQALAGIVVCDAEGKINLINEAAKSLALCDSDGEPIPRVSDIWGEMLDTSGRPIPAEESPCMRALRGETTVNQECHLIRPGASSFDILFTTAPIMSNQQVVGAISSVTDITQRKREEVQRREEAVSKERNRMASDLHDTVCQSLNAIVLLLEAAEDEFSQDSETARRHFRRAHEVARESLIEARRSMWTLCNESLEKEDLAPALSFIARQLFAGTPVKLELSLQPETCTLSSELRRELLRIGREGLANVLKHANATTVHLDLVFQKREVQLCIYDNGHGFLGTPPPSARRGWGLNNMRKRAERMGGKLEVNSRPGQGTRLMAALPLPASSR